MKVGLDVDGVLANFYLSMCERYKQPYGILNDWHGCEFINNNLVEVNVDSEFWKTLRVLNDPSMLDFEFDYYITSIPDGMKEAREFWLKSNGFPDKPVIVAHDKLTACRALGVSILIDDKPSTLEIFREQDDVIGIQYIPPYYDMGTWGDYQVSCFSDIKDLLETLKS